MLKGVYTTTVQHNIIVIMSGWLFRGLLRSPIRYDTIRYVYVYVITYDVLKYLRVYTSVTYLTSDLWSCRVHLIFFIFIFLNNYLLIVSNCMYAMCQ